MRYRTSMTFPFELNVTDMNPRAVVDANPSYGASFGFRLPQHAGELIEVRWTGQDSYVHSQDIRPTFPSVRSS
jgi:hypothetical protein